LFYWQELDREQLAEVFDVESATIGSRLHRARQAMKVLLNQQTPIPTEPLDIDAWARQLSTDDA